MKAAQEAAKAKAPAKERKNIFFNIQESVSSTTGAFFMLIIFCNGKERSKLIIPFLSIRAPISQYKTRLLLLSCCIFFIYPVRVHKRMPLPGLSKIVCSQSRFFKM
jgi:hypothetical protein